MKYHFKGLQDNDVKEMRTKFGSNELTKVKPESFLNKLKENLKDPLIIILSVALLAILILSAFQLAEWFEAFAIGVAIVLAVMVSTLSEYKNESSFQKLQEEASQIKSNVFRNGSIVQLPISEIVKNDYILLQTGDKIAADGIVIQGELKVNQASLTGESESIRKSETSTDYELKDKDFSDPHYVFRGSTIDNGEAVVLVDKVGTNTFYGQLTEELSISDERLSPLQLKLKKLAILISKFGYWGAGFIALAFLFNKIVVANQFDINMIVEALNNWKLLINEIVHAVVLAIIIIVAAVPEGLPMMIAIVLSLNMRKMLREKVLVRKLLGIETAGSLNILFSDKTGTITRGKLEATFCISGINKLFDSYTEIPENLRVILRTAILENSFSVLSPDGVPIGGNISEQALINYIDKNERKNSDTNERINTIRFNSTAKFSATEVKLDSTNENIFKSQQVTFVKGATEIILENCISTFDEKGNKLSLENKDKLIQMADEYAERGIRLIALAVSDESIAADEHLPGNLSLIGIIGIKDEIRTESKTAIQEALSAGIHVVMITGDRKGTAASIAKEVGLITNDSDIVLTSTELQTYPDEKLQEMLPRLKVVARALPTDKSRLVKISKSIGKVVGMTGDGVNDSPALKQADVGFAMGSGSEVAKEASDIVILDDNFKSITSAVRYGRTIFKSVRRFIVFQLTVNIAAVFTIFLSQIFNLQLPLTIIQILWINIIMDTLAALAFGSEPALKRYMSEAPINRDDNVLTKQMINSMFTGGFYIVVFSLIFLSSGFVESIFTRNGVPSYEVLMTVFFNIFIFMIVFNSFSVRTDKINIFENIKLNYNFLIIIGLIMILQISFTFLGGEFLSAKPLHLNEWIIVILTSLSILVVQIIRKLITKQNQ